MKKDNRALPMIIGPTASGKTALAIAVAKKLDAEIVSADSIQVYKDLDIGSAKPNKKERLAVKHHLIDAIYITDSEFSVARFRRMADLCIEDIRSRDKIPLIVGGTGLYINSLTYPLNFTQTGADKQLRDDLQRKEEANPGILYEILREVDPQSYERLHKNDQKRIIRALEVYYKTGKALSEYGNDFSNSDGLECIYSPIIVGLTMPRELLYQRINARVDEMLNSGLIEEVRTLLDYDRSLPALQGLGYKQILAYFYGECSLVDAVEDIKRNTRRFAKRQITWFKRDKRISWFNITEYESNESLVASVTEFLQSKLYMEEG